MTLLQLSPNKDHYESLRHYQTQHCVPRGSYSSILHVFSQQNVLLCASVYSAEILLGNFNSVRKYGETGSL